MWNLHGQGSLFSLLAYAKSLEYCLAQSMCRTILWTNVLYFFFFPQTSNPQILRPQYSAIGLATYFTEKMQLIWEEHAHTPTPKSTTPLQTHPYFPSHLSQRTVCPGSSLSLTLPTVHCVPLSSAYSSLFLQSTLLFPASSVFPLNWIIPIRIQIDLGENPDAESKEVFWCVLGCWQPT